MDIIKVDTKKTRLISDGGCGYLEIDNSFNAFLASCNRMYLGVKADIRFTKDRVIVTSRYRDLRKLTNKKIHISLTNYEDLKALPLKNDEFSRLTTLSTFSVIFLVLICSLSFLILLKTYPTKYKETINIDGDNIEIITTKIQKKLIDMLY